MIKLTTDDEFKEKCTKDVLWVDYKNITKVLEPGKRIFIDDGLISVVATEIGNGSTHSEGSPLGVNLVH
jgi:pyruvate kinase